MAFSTGFRKIADGVANAINSFNANRKAIAAAPSAVSQKLPQISSGKQVGQMGNSTINMQPRPAAPAPAAAPVAAPAPAQQAPRQVQPLRPRVVAAGGPVAPSTMPGAVR
jgi:hypothetical protein